MIDYEQLYYDLLYHNKKLKNKIKELEQELDIYRFNPKNKNTKDIVIESLAKYLVERKNE